MVKKMIYNDLITHNKILSYLQSTIENNTIPNAFLFYGQKGIGKIAYAIEFSASLLCLNPNDNWSCGQRNSCMKIKTINMETLIIYYQQETKTIVKMILH